MKEALFCHEVSLEYYITENREKTLPKYGIEVIKKQYLNEKPDVEKSSMYNLTNDEKKISSENDVTPDNVEPMRRLYGTLYSKLAGKCHFSGSTMSSLKCALDQFGSISHNMH